MTDRNAILPTTPTHATVAPATVAPALVAPALVALGALMVLGALASAMVPSWSQLMVTGLTLINGPVLEGPLLDLGGLLNGQQLGQFQQ
ncbi:hypothetical protein F7P69_23965 [Cellulosimicrobium funkei]|nr:hypothetical protein [Cellulosimicrobium funkei]